MFQITTDHLTLMIALAICGGTITVCYCRWLVALERNEKADAELIANLSSQGKSAKEITTIMDIKREKSPADAAIALSREGFETDEIIKILGKHQ